MASSRLLEYDYTVGTFSCSFERLQILKNLGIVAKYMTDSLQTRHILKECMKKEGPNGMHGSFIQLTIHIYYVIQFINYNYFI